MITISILWIILFISLVLIVSGLYFQKKALLLVILGGVLLMITGLLSFSDPISISTINENYTYDNGTLTDVTQQLAATPINSNLNRLISWVNMLLGLACMIGASIKLYDSRFDEDDPEDIKIFGKD